jgi:hypothetical protein
MPYYKSRRIHAPRTRDKTSFDDMILNSSSWQYFKHYDKEFKLNDQEEMPTWEIIKDPNILEANWTTMYPAQELDKDKALHYKYDDIDRAMDPVDLSELGFRSPQDKAKLVDMSPLPHWVPWEHYETIMATSKWHAFKCLPETLFKIAHLREDIKIALRNHVHEEVPSLWVYYERLPSWATDNPIVKQAVVALENYHPHTNMRDKEMMINFMLSVLTPMQPEVEEIMASRVNNVKIRLNHERGRKMMTELKPWDFDPSDIGSQYHANYVSDEEADEDEYGKDNR